MAFKMKGFPKSVVAKGKEQIYKKEIKQLEGKISKTTNDAERTTLQKRIDDIRDKAAGHGRGDRPYYFKKGFEGVKEDLKIRRKNN